MAATMRQSSAPTFLTSTIRVNSLRQTIKKARAVKKNSVATIGWFLSTTGWPPTYQSPSPMPDFCVGAAATGAATA
ncbi:hypothetical protein DL766_006815 [Monosporascus sp. MC13-8B]|uniref:Uncharacterized protein n=1 Tax=Monosporascus cannonballus TaxID=155416 RepID=A0ABY0H5Y2_9PEZI|nr:hypothetical protein DL762_006171 [Monosporascus cannonballus]RYO90978.1 hypothetical protein DL763_005149 [Monosporascus cannonballus]RYP26142.1 hypothetical protein DL766_006815 [Monosporascus sp. MC13-8B]